MNREPLSADARQMDGALRQQLNDVSAACQMLQRRCESERDMEYLEVIHRAVLRSVRILQNRELARRLEDEDELRAVYGTVELVDWCRTLTGEAAELLETMELTLAFRTELTALITLADEELLSQMVLELLSNAAKHTPAGGRLSVSLLKRVDSAVITVGDEGDGLGEEALARLYSGQAESLDLTPEAGAGLGLRLARTFAEIHGGLMMVDTAPGGGVRVAVSIPLREEHRERMKSPSDLSGGYERALVALSDVLPARAFRMGKRAL